MTHAPRFAAEFGHQAPPTYATLREALSDDPLTPSSPTMLHHQKALGGDDKLHTRLAEHVRVPSDFEAWLYATQLNQARAIPSASPTSGRSSPSAWGRSTGS